MDATSLRLVLPGILLEAVAAKKERGRSFHGSETSPYHYYLSWWKLEAHVSSHLLSIHLFEQLIQERQKVS